MVSRAIPVNDHTQWAVWNGNWPRSDELEGGEVAWRWCPLYRKESGIVNMCIDMLKMPKTHHLPTTQMAYSEGDAFFGIFTILAQISDLHPPATHPQPCNPSRNTHSTPHRCNNLARPRVRRWDFSSVIAHATHMEGANATRSTPMTYCVFPFESQCTYVSCCTTYNYVGHPCIPHPLRI